MSLDKAIAAGKEWRQPYRGSARFDPACRHGACPWCAGNFYRRGERVRRDVALEQAREAEEDGVWTRWR